MEIEHLVRTDFTQLDVCFASNDRETLDFPRMVVIAARNARHSGRKRYLTADAQLDRLDKHTARIDMPLEFHGEILLRIDIASECIEEIHFVAIPQLGNNSFVEI